jgi:hypothetical protein
MKTTPENPPSNILGSGASEQKVLDAISGSGYPLQLIVARHLSPIFTIEEEWSYVDSGTGSSRTIDLVASKWLFEFKEPQPRIRPTLNLVIECKQSHLPYIFFLSESHPWLPDFPVIAGLKSNSIVITSDDNPSTWNFPPIYILGLRDHPFLTESPSFCMTFSKCVRKGSNLVLSGSEPYQNLVFPIIKAVSHFESVSRPPSTAYYFDCELVVGLAVLDAPMVGVRVMDSGNEISLLPWVRLIRHEPHEGEHKFEKSQVLGIDIVHKDYLDTYIHQHVIPFAEEFSKLSLKHADILADSRGFVTGMGANWWNEIEPRLQPFSFLARRKRGKAILERIICLLRGQSNK